MSRSGLFALAALSFCSLSCSTPQHAVDEKYFLLSTNINVPYWQEAKAGLTRAGAQLGVKVEMVGPDTYDPAGERDEFRKTMAKKPTGIAVSASDANLLKPEIDAAIAQAAFIMDLTCFQARGKGTAGSPETPARFTLIPAVCPPAHRAMWPRPMRGWPRRLRRASP